MMMIQILAELTGLGIELWTDGKQLFYRGAREIVTRKLLNRIKQEKGAIIEALTAGGFVSKSFPLSHPQRALWYIYQSNPENPAYNIAMAVRLRFKVNHAVLRETLQMLLVRHPMLRSVFALNLNGGATESIQKVYAYQRVHLEEVDAASWSMDELRTKVKADHERPFDLENGPVFRATLFHRDADDAVLLMSVHHIACDGWSMWLLMDEFWKIYLHKIERETASQDPEPLVYPDTTPALTEKVCQQIKALERLGTVDFSKINAMISGGGSAKFQRLIAGLVLNLWRQMGVIPDEDGKYDRNQLMARLGILPRYTRLFNALLQALEATGWVTATGDSLMVHRSESQKELLQDRQALQALKDELVNDTPQLAGYVNLVWACADALPEILTGRRDYLEVMFPKGSMELVEKTYAGNQMVDFYNHTVAELVKSYIEHRVRLNPGARVRVLEVGAGTGGTGKFVLEALQEYGLKGQVEYLYTDVSLAFTRYGEAFFGKQYPFVRFKLFDVEKEPQSQDFQPDSIDLVIASNVLHATRQIENTLGQIKKLLKNHGILVINELTAAQDFLTLTFGLTEGWWLYEDETNRLKNSPLLGPEQWKQLLGKAGFGQVQLFGLADQRPELQDVTWQNVIVAESDGVVKVQPDVAVPGLELPKLAHHYDDFVRGQQELLSGAEGERQWQYWRKRLAGELPLLNLEPDYPRPEVQTFAGHWHPFWLSGELSEALAKFAKENGITLYTLLLTAYLILLHRYSGQEDILVGCPTAGRAQRMFDGIVGLFINPVVVRADFSNDPPLNQFTDQIQQTVIAALDHQDYPFSLLVDRLNPKRDAGR